MQKEFIDDWEKFNETLLPEKEDFYSHLNIEDITETDYVHAKIVWNGSGINNLGRYRNFYVQSDILLLSDVF